MEEKIDEKKLRLEIIKALESQIGKENVEDKHGHYEFGCDIIFYIVDPFGEKRKFGIQLKNVNVDGSNTHEILGQLSVSFGHEYSLDKKLLDAVYVITSGTISPGAEESFKKANVGFRNVYLIDYKKLTPFLEDFRKKLYSQKTITKET